MGTPVFDFERDDWFVVPGTLRWVDLCAALESIGWNGALDSTFSFEETGLGVPPGMHANDTQFAFWVFRNAAGWTFGVVALEDTGTRYWVLMSEVAETKERITEVVNRLGCRRVAFPSRFRGLSTGR